MRGRWGRRRARSRRITLASWWTLLHDLVTAGLGAAGVMDQRAYEDRMSSPTVFRTIPWFLMIGYLVAFVTYQLVFVIFNR